MVSKFQMSAADAVLMKESYVNADQLLGPIDAENIQHDTVHQYFFEEHNRVYKRLQKKPAIIVGRRGSGKTALLKQIEFSNPNAIVSHLAKDRAIAKVMSLMPDGAGGVSFVEESQRWWEFAIWIAALNDIREHNRLREVERGSLPQSMAALFHKLRIEASTSATLAVERVLEAISETSTKPGVTGSLASLLRQLMGGDDIDFESLRKQVDAYAKAQKIPIFVVADSLDDYPLGAEKLKPTLRGMLKCFGSFNQRYHGLQVRLCLPAEAYQAFEEISTNEVKDFQRTLAIHWSSAELISIAAERLRLSLNMLPRSNTSAAYLARINETDLSDRGEARRFLDAILPSSVVNRFGQHEHPVAYLLRHTQLLPRQILFLLQSVLSTNMSKSDKQEVSPQAIVDGVRQVEDHMWHEVCKAYHFAYPHAYALCIGMIPNLPSSFTEAEFDSVFAQAGKNAVKDREFKSTDALRTLVGIGAVGLFTGESEKYLEGQFQYTSLRFIPDLFGGRYVLHPMFSGMPEKMGSAEFQMRRSKPVHPVGSDPAFDLSPYGN